ncbi:MAG: hypothetical protein CL678_05315 [Bdellovibrionaceae bacterium]|nr:hypothetical protein [Pseudobdellovibrionaceae bacterium]|tara:strand:+ start:208 stop:645 length:438 start_codon:yes stop_codon:yes gene_type:complete
MKTLLFSLLLMSGSAYAVESSAPAVCSDFPSAEPCVELKEVHQEIDRVDSRITHLKNKIKNRKNLASLLGRKNMIDLKSSRMSQIESLEEKRDELEIRAYFLEMAILASEKFYAAAQSLKKQKKSRTLVSQEEVVYASAKAQAAH